MMDKKYIIKIMERLSEIKFTLIYNNIIYCSFISLLIYLLVSNKYEKMYISFNVTSFSKENIYLLFIIIFIVMVIINNYKLIYNTNKIISFINVCIGFFNFMVIKFGYSLITKLILLNT